MRRDPLSALARLRASETLLARRALAAATSSVVEAEAALAKASAALQAEARLPGADLVGAFAGWLPRGLAEQHDASGRAQSAEAAASLCRTEVAAARAAERLVEACVTRRAVERRRDALRREALRLADLPARDRAASLPEAVPPV